ncbi:MAG: hypothetical protein HY063_14530 [Bacteroidetes bacterium]|nr:hypothetical protein [Bacteroidota bacterium]
MKKIFLLFFLIFILFLTGCFDTVEETHIYDQYIILAIDVSDNMCIVFKNEDYSNSTVIAPTVFDVEWNNDYILAKQHPASFKNAIISDFYPKIFDSLRKNNWEDDIYWRADSLATIKYKKNFKLGLYNDFIDKSKNEITLYYLIDTRFNDKKGKLYLTLSELDKDLIKLNVGKFTNKKYFSSLDYRLNNLLILFVIIAIIIIIIFYFHKKN